MVFTISLRLSKYKVSAFKESHENTTSKDELTFSGMVIDIQNSRAVYLPVFSSSLE